MWIAVPLTQHMTRQKDLSDDNDLHGYSSDGSFLQEYVNLKGLQQEFVLVKKRGEPSKGLQGAVGILLTEGKRHYFSPCFEYVL